MYRTGSRHRLARAIRASGGWSLSVALVTVMSAGVGHAQDRPALQEVAFDQSVLPAALFVSPHALVIDMDARAYLPAVAEVDPEKCYVFLVHRVSEPTLIGATGVISGGAVNVIAPEQWGMGGSLTSPVSSSQINAAHRACNRPTPGYARYLAAVEVIATQEGLSAIASQEGDIAVGAGRADAEVGVVVNRIVGEALRGQAVEGLVDSPAFPEVSASTFQFAGESEETVLQAAMEGSLPDLSAESLNVLASFRDPDYQLGMENPAGEGIGFLTDASPALYLSTDIGMKLDQFTTKGWPHGQETTGTPFVNASFDPFMIFRPWDPVTYHFESEPNNRQVLRNGEPLIKAGRNLMTDDYVRIDDAGFSIFQIIIDDDHYCIFDDIDNYQTELRFICDETNRVQRDSNDYSLIRIE